jgi:hypothetical protein
MKDLERKMLEKKELTGKKRKAGAAHGTPERVGTKA